MPGIAIRAAAPAGSASNTAGTDDSGSPAAMTATGSNLLAHLRWVLPRIVENTLTAIAPPESRATPLFA